MSQQAGVWVKASERLPDIEGNYFVRVQGVEHDNDNAEYTSGAYYRFVNTFQGKYFPLLPKNETVIEWLDEQPIPVKKIDDEWIEQIEQVLEIKETNVALAHMQQLIDLLYKHYKTSPQQPVPVNQDEKNNIMKEAYDAIKWNYNNLDEIQNFGTEVIDMGGVPTTNGGIESWPLQVKTEEGNVVMEYDNWLIRCDDGTYYVRKTVEITPKQKSAQQPIPVQEGLREAAEELLHLHLCEQEGLQSGKPTFKQWVEAVNKLSDALNSKEEVKK